MSPRTPALVVGGIFLVRVFFSPLCEQIELSWFDRGLKARSEWGFARPLDPRIQFFELNMNEEIAEKYAQDGDYAITAETLKTISGLGAKVIALDVHYSHGKVEDQRGLSETIRELNKAGRTRVVSSLIIDGDKLKYSSPLRKLPSAGIRTALWKTCSGCRGNR